MQTFVSKLSWLAYVEVIGLLPEEQKDESFVEMLESAIEASIKQVTVFQPKINPSEVIFRFDSDVTVTKPTTVPITIRIEMFQTLGEVDLHNIAALVRRAIVDNFLKRPDVVIIMV